VEFSLLNILNGMPTDSQVNGHIVYGRVPGQLKHVSLETFGTSPIGICKRYSRLAYYPTGQTTQPLNDPFLEDRTLTFGKRPPHAEKRSFLFHCSTPTMRTRLRSRVQLDSEKGAALLKPRGPIMDSLPRNSKTVIPYARGHGLLAFSDLSQQQMKEIMSSFPYPTLVRSDGKSQRKSKIRGLRRPNRDSLIVGDVFELGHAEALQTKIENCPRNSYSLQMSYFFSEFMR
jgi:hypothetical protein